MNEPVERDSAALLLPLLRGLCDLSPDHAVWKNADAGLDGTGDVDFVAPRSTWPAVEDAFRSWARDEAMGPVIACRHMPDTIFLIAVDRDRSDFVQLDVRSRMTFRGSTVFVAEDLRSCFELDDRGFRCLRPGAEGLLKLVVSGIAPGGRSKDRALAKEGVVELLSRDPHGVEAAAALLGPVGTAARSGAEALTEGKWNRRAMAAVETWFVIKGLTEPFTALGRARAKRAKAGCELIQTSIRSSRLIPGDLDEWLARVEQDHAWSGARSRETALSRNRSSQPGMVLSVVGPDGVGKSTLIDALLADELKDRRIMRIRNVGMLPRRTVPGAPVTEPHKDPVYPAALSFAKLGYVFVDYLAGWFLRLRPFVRRGGWVVLERGWWDMAVDPTRYRLKVPVRLMFGLGRLLPKPDILFVLEAPAATVLERKQELSLEELERQRRVWRELLPNEQKRVFLDATVAASEVVASARHSIGGMKTGASREAPVNLPSAGNARWVLPRTPRSAAEKGLHIYHPVTLRGLAGWHLARAGATMGLFALLPKGSPPDSTVAEMLAPHVPEGGTTALARTNHTGRYVALVLDRDGRSVAAAKIASNDAGRSKLESEATRMSQFSAYLPPPLSTPRLLVHEEGLLLMEPIPWASRARPWRLPTDVAASLGEFFAGGNGGGLAASGLTHGDFAPWNLLKTKSGWVLLDWEEAKTSGEPFWDVFHFLVQGNALLRRPTRGALLSGLHGRGWVGAGIRAYAQSAGLSVEEAPDRFRVYLESSQGELDAQSSDGRAGLRARRDLLGDLKD